MLMGIRLLLATVQQTAYIACSSDNTYSFSQTWLTYKKIISDIKCSILVRKVERAIGGKKEGKKGWTDRQTDRQIDREAGRQAGRRTDGRTDGKTDRRTDGKTDRRTDRQIDGWMDGWIDR